MGMIRFLDQLRVSVNNQPLISDITMNDEVSDDEEIDALTDLRHEISYELKFFSSTR